MNVGMSQNKKYYVAFDGREPGVYDSWPKCHDQVNRYSGACHKSYKSYEEAKSDFQAFRGNGKNEGPSGVGNSKSQRSSGKHENVKKEYDYKVELDVGVYGVEACGRWYEN